MISLPLKWSGKKSGRTDEDEKRRLEHELAANSKELQNAERLIEELQRAYNAAESRYQQGCINYRTLQEQHAHDIARLKSDHKHDVAHARYMQDRLEQDHKSNFDKMEANHRKIVNQLEERIERERNRLTGQLLSNQDDTQGWPDDILGIKFRGLQASIDSITSSPTRDFIIPENCEVGSHLDPTNFLGRAGRLRSQFLIRSTIWAILREHFFGTPWGFGVLGPGSGQNELTRVYSTWWTLFENSGESAQSNCTDFTVFSHDTLANKWRSASFQCISIALRAVDGGNSAPESLLAKLSTENTNQAVNRIMALLREVCTLSNSLMREEIPGEVNRLATLAREFGLQFGVHNAQLRLLVPNIGQQIQIGNEFRDVIDGDLSRGSSCMVDLVVVPGLQRIGDGRSDMATKRVIIPCEFYTHEPPS